MARALYIHWPFCAKKCPYCDFNSHVREGVDTAAWQTALIADMRAEAALAGGETLTSIFFGGGTPSLISRSGPMNTTCRPDASASRITPF